MAELKELETQLQTKINQTKQYYASLEAKGDGVTQEDRDALERMITEGKGLRTEITQLTELKGLEGFVSLGSGRAPLSEGLQGQSGGLYLPGEGRKSWGQLVVESETYQHNNGRDMGAVDVKAHLRPQDPRHDIQQKALYGATDAAGGIMTQPVYYNDPLDIARQRPRSILDMVTTIPTTSDAVAYVQMITRTNTAAVVPEYSAGAFGLKPESNLVFAGVTAPVRTIATWIGASRQILDDAPRLRGTIDNELTYMVQVALEDQILNGDGTGNNFTGILQTAGIQLRVMSASAPTGRGQLTTDTKADTLRRAITDIRLAFYQPDAIVLNPADAEAVELLKATTNEYINTEEVQIYDPVAQRIWRVPLVETAAIPALTALVGNFRMGATLWDRMQTEIRVGEPTDYFLRNAVAILAELRAAFGVPRPLAFEKITLI
jgi:HK97 family phage major capsid protein